MGVFGFGLVTLIFVYAFVDNVIEKPDGIVISLAFIAGIVVISLVSRLARATELRADGIDFDEAALRMIDEADHSGHLHLIANKIQAGDVDEYREKEAEQRALNPIPENARILFLEIAVSDPSEFSKTSAGARREGRRLLDPARGEHGRAQRAGRDHAAPARRHGPAPPPVLPVVGGQPARAPRALRPVRHRARPRR